MNAIFHTADGLVCMGTIDDPETQDEQPPMRLARIYTEHPIPRPGVGITDPEKLSRRVREYWLVTIQPNGMPVYQERVF